MRACRAQVITLFVVSLGVMVGRRAVARGGETSEYPVKAAFIYNFVQFVEWPTSAFGGDAKAPLEIAIVGNDPFNGMLDRLVAGKIVNGHPVVVRHFATANDARQPCHVMFVSAQSQEQFAPTIQKLGRANMLTIGETDKFLDAGGIIRIYTDDNHIRFDVNRGSAERAGLHVSAKLLKLAKNVKD
jgi:hypothetical protein